MSLKLHEMNIKGLKCYEDSGQIPFHNLSVFIGENDSGKSTILDALEYFLENNQPLSGDYREGMNRIEITCKFDVLQEIEEFNDFILDDTITIKKTFFTDATPKIEILGEVFVDNDLNTFRTMNAPDLKALLIRLGLDSQSNQDLRKESVEEYISVSDLAREAKYVDIRWNEIVHLLPVFQRYSSSDYGNPTSSIRKTLELVYRQSFYDVDEEGNETLKTDFQDLQTEIEDNLNNKLETQLLAHIKKYKPEIDSISGTYNIDFTKGLSFTGLNIDDGSGRQKTLEQMGDGSKKKVFLSILEWDAEINMVHVSNRHIIRAYDEPDAHLHYHAQREMFYIIKDLAEADGSNIQSIICTHALTMIDRAPAKCINHVIKTDDKSKVKFLQTDDDSDITEFLNQISEISGFKNSNIFYEKCFLLVEGEGEENALPIMYKKYADRSLIEDGIVLINLQTNGQWSNALKFLNANKKDATVLFLDTDTQYPDSNSRVTTEKLEEIGFDDTYLTSNCFFIGTKEFEDVFSDGQYKELCNAHFPKPDTLEWFESDFLNLRGETKFSESLRVMLSRECRRYIGKPEISLKIAQSLTSEEILQIEPIKNLFVKINEIIS